MANFPSVQTDKHQSILNPAADNSNVPDLASDYPFISLCLILLIVIGVIVYNFPSSAEIIKCVASCAVMITVIYSVLTYQFNYKKTLQESKKSRDTLTFSTAMEWTKPGIFDRVMEAWIVETANPNLLDERDGEKFFTFLQDPKNVNYKKSVHTILNFLESVALGVNQGLLDREFIKGFFELSYKRNIEDYYFYIKHRRDVLNNQDIWKEFINLAKEWGVEPSAYLNKKGV